MQKSRNEVGERALEDGNFSVIQKKENVRINNELRKILGYCKDYAAVVSESDLMTESLQFSKESFEKFMGDKIRGKEAVIRKSTEEFNLLLFRLLLMHISGYLCRKEGNNCIKTANCKPM